MGLKIHTLDSDSDLEYWSLRVISHNDLKDLISSFMGNLGISQALFRGPLGSTLGPVGQYRDAWGMVWCWGSNVGCQYACVSNPVLPSLALI